KKANKNTGCAVALAKWLIQPSNKLRVRWKSRNEKNIGASAKRKLITVSAIKYVHMAWKMVFPNIISAARINKPTIMPYGPVENVATSVMNILVEVSVAMALSSVAN